MPRGLRSSKKQNPQGIKIASVDSLRQKLVSSDTMRQPLQQAYELRQTDRTQEFYQSGQWKALSSDFKTENNFCFACGKTDASRLYCDHIISIKTPEGWEKRMDWLNLQSLCPSCHANKSKEDRKLYADYEPIARTNPVRKRKSRDLSNWDPSC